MVDDEQRTTPHEIHFNLICNGGCKKNDGINISNSNNIILPLKN